MHDNEDCSPIIAFAVLCLAISFFFGMFVYANGCQEDQSNRPAAYYCGSRGGLAAANLRGNQFVCNDGTNFRLHLETTQEGFTTSNTNK